MCNIICYYVIENKHGTFEVWLLHNTEFVDMSNFLGLFYYGMKSLFVMQYYIKLGLGSVQKLT